MIDVKILKEKYEEIKKVVENSNATYEEKMYANGVYWAIVQLYSLDKKDRGEEFKYYVEKILGFNTTLKKIIADARGEASFDIEDALVGEYNDNGNFRKGYEGTILLDARPGEDLDYCMILATRREEQILEK